MPFSSPLHFLQFICPKIAPPDVIRVILSFRASFDGPHFPQFGHVIRCQMAAGLLNKFDCMAERFFRFLLRQRGLRLKVEEGAEF